MTRLEMKTPASSSHSAEMEKLPTDTVHPSRSLSIPEGPTSRFRPGVFLNRHSKTIILKLVSCGKRCWRAAVAAEYGAWGVVDQI